MNFKNNKTEYLRVEEDAFYSPKGRYSASGFFEKIRYLICIIPLSPPETQQQMVAEIEAEQKAIDECKRLITTHEQKKLK